MKRYIGIVVMSLLAVLAGFAFKKPEGFRPTTTEASLMEGLRVVSRDNGAVVWRLEAAGAVMSEDGKTANLREVRVSIPERAIDVRSDKGFYEVEKGALTLSGGVRAETPDYTVRTDSVSLRGGRELVTDDKVVIEGKGVRIEGKGLRAKENALLLKDVKAFVY